MVFSSLVFLFFFLPLTLFFYWVVPRGWRNTWLLLVSLIFYAWGEPIYVGLMVFSTLFDYGNGLLLQRFQHHRRKQKWVVIASVSVNLGLLAYFKYSGFFITTLNQIFHLSLPVPEVSLPIGISFYTFQTMSYTLDVFKGDAAPQKNPIHLGAYVAMFPQLIAGPIVRYKDVATQLANRCLTVAKTARGIERFTIGLGKKLLLANPVGEIWTRISESDLSQTSGFTLWLGLIAFGLQIYFDFSGYSDMAIGLGRMLGFELMENFNYPYLSKSISEFWRRWHISLGNWFRDYIYIPLGGNRVRSSRAQFNLFAVWFLTGFWHGASWNFICWGLYFWALIVGEKAWLGSWLKEHPIMAHVYTLCLLVVGWGLFAFDALPEALDYLHAMLTGGLSWIGTDSLYYVREYGGLLLLAILGTTPWHRALIKHLPSGWAPHLSWLKPVGVLLLLVASTAFLVDASFNPFLYFRF